MNKRFKCELRPEGVVLVITWWGQKRATVKITKQICVFVTYDNTTDLLKIDLL